MQRHFWRESYFNDLLKRLETNSDVDPTIVEIDKAKYRRMLKGDQSKQNMTLKPQPFRIAKRKEFIEVLQKNMQRKVK